MDPVKPQKVIKFHLTQCGHRFLTPGQHVKLFGKYSNLFLNPQIINSNIERTLMQWPSEKKKKVILLAVDSQYAY